jgi:hypothetical protein
MGVTPVLVTSLGYVRGCETLPDDLPTRLSSRATATAGQQLPTCVRAHLILLLGDGRHGQLAAQAGERVEDGEAAHVHGAAPGNPTSKSDPSYSAKTNTIRMTSLHKISTRDERRFLTVAPRNLMYFFVIKIVATMSDIAAARPSKSGVFRGRPLRVSQI